MLSQCSVCVHPDRLDIDGALVDGTSYRNIAKRFGASISALSRHQSEHMRATVAEVSSCQPENVEQIRPYYRPSKQLAG